MATTSTYYLNGPTLDTATSVFIDPDMTLVAPDGYYKEGSNVRELVSGVFQPTIACPSCGVACDTTVTVSGDIGVFYLDVQTGGLPANTGAIVLKFNPGSTPVGIKATYNGVTYNDFSSPSFGFLSPSTGQPIFLGNTIADCGIVAGSPHVLDVFNYYSGSFFNTGSTESISVVSGDMKTTLGIPGECIMVIPKLTPTPTTISLEIVAPCSGYTFDVTAICPVTLSSFDISLTGATSVDACLLDITEVCYSVPVNGSSSLLGLYDWVFYGSSGQNILDNGYYKCLVGMPSGKTWFQVDNGIIINFGTC